MKVKVDGKIFDVEEIEIVPNYPNLNKLTIYDEGILIESEYCEEEVSFETLLDF